MRKLTRKLKKISRERAQEREVKIEGSRERSQDRGLKRESSRKGAQERDQERAQESDLDKSFKVQSLKRSEPCPVGACFFLWGRG